MELNDILNIGLSKENTHLVEDEHTAIHIGSGASKVLATPWMIALMERASHRLLAERLPEGYSSVGVEVHVRHLTPTPVGSTVRIRTEITRVEGLRVVFKVQAWDETELAGEGEHTRMVINAGRFQKRVLAKTQHGGAEEAA